MSERPDQNAGEPLAGPHGSTDDHGDTHGHDDHAHAGTALGPVDVISWGMAALGIVLGLVVAFALIQAAS